MEVEGDDFKGRAKGTNAVNNLTNITTEHVREKEKTKRLLIVIVFLLMVLAVLIILFAPPGKETMAYIFGASLLVLALGAIGASRFILKLFGITVDTTDGG